MPCSRLTGPRFYRIVLGGFVATVLLALPSAVDVWARPLTASEREIVQELRKKQAEKAREKKDKEYTKTVVLNLINDVVHEPLMLNPVTGFLVSQLEAAGGGYLKRKFYDEPWMKEVHHKYTTTLSKMVNAAFKGRKKDKAELDRINSLLEQVGDDDPEAKRTLEDEKRHLERSIEATDDVIDRLNKRIDDANKAKREFDHGGDIPKGFQSLLDNLEKEIKDAIDRKRQRMAEPEEETKTSCKDLKDQQVEIERKLYAEFQRRRNDPGMLLEAQRAQNEKMRLQAQMATCAD